VELARPLPAISCPAAAQWRRPGGDTGSYSQIDASATYHITPQVAVFVEGANLTNAMTLKYAYYTNQFLYAEDSGGASNLAQGSISDQHAGGRAPSHACPQR
jgi:hypothetical protein